MGSQGRSSWLERELLISAERQEIPIFCNSTYSDAVFRVPTQLRDPPPNESVHMIYAKADPFSQSP
jgi:hypothetical protein